MAVGQPALEGGVVGVQTEGAIGGEKGGAFAVGEVAGVIEMRVGIEEVGGNEVVKRRDEGAVGGGESGGEGGHLVAGVGRAARKGR